MIGVGVIGLVILFVSIICVSIIVVIVSVIVSLVAVLISKHRSNKPQSFLVGIKAFILSISAIVGALCGLAFINLLQVFSVLEIGRTGAAHFLVAAIFGLGVGALFALLFNRLIVDKIYALILNIGKK